MAQRSKKISTKVWRPVLDELNKQLNKACVRRDAYLNRVLEVELPYLAAIERTNSKDVKRFVSSRLDMLDRKLVTLALDPALVEQLDQICVEKGIVRDVFFNRLFFLLVAPQKFIDDKFFYAWQPKNDSFNPDTWRIHVWAEGKHDSGAWKYMFHPLKADINPFWSIRYGLDEGGSDESDIYTVVFREGRKADLYGLNCFMANHDIPGHPEGKPDALELLLEDVVDEQEAQW